MNFLQYLVQRVGLAISSNQFWGKNSTTFIQNDACEQWLPSHYQMINGFSSILLFNWINCFDEGGIFTIQQMC